MNTRLEQMNALLGKQINVKNQQEINKEIIKYVEIRNNRYSLNLTKEKCRQIGISPLEYQRVVVDLEKINKLVTDVGQRARPEALLANYKEIFLADRTEGKISTDGQEMRSQGIWVPTGYKYVRFNCWAGAALTPLFICKVYNFGVMKVGTWSGVRGKYGVVDVSLDASNSAAVLYFQTSDSNGGFANWELRK